jgi:hypothetical protein
MVMHASVTQRSIHALVKELNGESVFGKYKLSRSALDRLRQFCADLEELERIRESLWQREPQAADPVDTAERLWAWPDWQLNDLASLKLSGNGERILKRVNAQLKPLRTSESIMLATEARGFRLILRRPIEVKNTAMGAMYFVLALLESGTLRRLRRCQRSECRRWLFAQTDWQKYCSQKCRQMESAQAERFKEKRRLYMRSRRREEKERESRAKDLAEKRGRK